MLTVIIIFSILFEVYIINKNIFMAIIWINIIVIFCIWEYLEIRKIVSEKLIDREILKYEEKNNILRDKIIVELKKSIYYYRFLSSGYSFRQGIGIIRILFPELKDNYYLDSILDEYSYNIKKIRNLNVEKNDICVAKWLVYFKN